MQFLTVTTPDNIEIQYRLAGAGSRLAAAVVDLLIQTAAFLLLALTVVFGIMGFRFSNVATFNFGGPALAFLIITFFIIYFGYFFCFELWMDGQTPGKKIFGLRAIRENGQPIAASHAAIRCVFRLMADMMGFGVPMIIFSKKNKRVGDMLASTVVVSESHQISAASLGYDKREESAILYDNLRLEPEEREWLKEFINRKNSFIDGGEYMQGRFIHYFAKKFNVEPNQLNGEMLEKILRLNL